MSTKTPKRTTKSKPAKSASKPKPAKPRKTTRVTRPKKKVEKEVPAEVEKPTLPTTEITQPELAQTHPPKTRKPIPQVERETEPPTEPAKPEVVTEPAKPEVVTEPAKPEVVQVKPEPEIAHVTPELARPISPESRIQPTVEPKKEIVEPSVVKAQFKKTTVVKRLPKPPPKRKLLEPPKGNMLLIIRLQGTFAVPNYIENTLRSLRLKGKFNATLAKNSSSTIGMLQQVKDYVTWGDLKATDIAILLSKRGELDGGNPVTDKFAMEAFSKDSINSLATALTTGEVSLRSLWEKGVKPVFRLRPPSGGFESTIKKSFTSTGELGYRGAAIAALMSHMT